LEVFEFIVNISERYIDDELNKKWLQILQIHEGVDYIQKLSMFHQLETV